MPPVYWPRLPCQLTGKHYYCHRDVPVSSARVLAAVKMEGGKRDSTCPSVSQGGPSFPAQHAIICPMK